MAGLAAGHRSGYRLLAARTAGRTTRIRRPARRSVADVLAKSATRLRELISTAV